MRDLHLALLSAVISIATSILGFFIQESAWNIVEILFLENILLLAIQIYLKQRDEDSELSTSLGRLRSDPKLWKVSVQLFREIADSKKHSNIFFSAQVLSFLSDARQAVASLNDGLLKIDLRPGGFFFREAEAPETASSTFWATSYVDPGPYWRGVIGARLLARSKRKVIQKVQTTRIFIEHVTGAAAIQDIIQQNKDAGVAVKLANADVLDARLRRDFAILDNGVLAVELVLGKDREPVEVRYYSPDTEAGRKAIAELISIWHQLDDLSQPQ